MEIVGKSLAYQVHIKVCNPISLRTSEDCKIHINHCKTTSASIIYVSNVLVLTVI